MRQLLEKLGVFTGLVSYAKPQTFEVVYRATLKNTGDKDISADIILGVPPTTETQKIIGEVKLMPQAHAIKKDEQYENTYALYQLTIKSRGEVVIEEHFTVSTKPISRAIDKKWTLRDYENSSSPFLATTPHTELSNELAAELAEWRKLGNLRQTIEAVNKYVMNRLVYGDPIPGLYSAKDALTRSAVDCGGFDTLFVALCQKLGVPARVVSGFWLGYEENRMHAWAELMLPNGTWIPVDPSVESQFHARRTLKLGRLGAIGSDRLILSRGTDINLETVNGKITADILQNPQVFGGDAGELKIETIVISKRV